MALLSHSFKGFQPGTYLLWLEIIFGKLGCHRAVGRIMSVLYYHINLRNTPELTRSIMLNEHKDIRRLKKKFEAFSDRITSI